MAKRPPDPASIAAFLTAKRDELSTRRQDIVAERRALFLQQREIERELQDCQATARLFQLDIEFPEFDRPGGGGENIARMERERIERLERERVAHAVASGRVHGVWHSQTRREARGEPPKPELIGPVGQPSPSDRPKPAVREFLLKQLQTIAPNGARAAELRLRYEKDFGVEIHEKTVGMTLYRLSKDHMVSREGHIWYYGANLNPSNVGAPK